MDIERLVADYLVAAREQAGRMRALALSAAVEDLTSLRLSAHRLRGSGQSFGFPEITRIAGKIEDLVVVALAGGAPEAPLAALCEDLRRVVDRAWRSREGSVAPARDG